MAALNFPSSPSVGQIYTANGLSWQWDGVSWVCQNQGIIAPATVAQGGTGATDAATARTNLGLAIGSNIQAWDADLDAIAAIAGTSGLLKKTAANTWTLDTNSYLTSVTKADVGLGNVENTALSTWVGSSNITTLGTIGTGTWNASVIDISKIGANLTGGRIPFGNGASALSSSANLMWSDTYTQLSIGGSSWVAAMLSIVGGTPTTSNFSEAFVVAPTLHAEATSGSHISSWLYTAPSTALTSHVHFMARQGTLGAGTTITDQYGYIASSTLRNATTNYGFYAGNAAAVTAGKTNYAFYAANNTATGGGTTWNFYAGGSAPNYFAGTTTFAGSVITSGLTGILKGNGASALTVAAAGTDYLAPAAIGTTVQAWDGDLDAIAALAGTSGFLKKTAANTWSLDTNTYLTGNQSITISGDASGSGATSISLTLATVPIGKGGTGQTTAAAAFNALSPVTTLGDIIYGSGANTAARLAGNTTTTKQFLRQTGTGTASAAPAWDTVTKSDVGLANVENTALSTWAGSANITTVGTISTGTWSATAIAVAKGGTGATDAATARTNLGLAIGTNVQAWDADLDAIAALAGASGLLRKTAANTWSLETSSAAVGGGSDKAFWVNDTAISADYTLPAGKNAGTFGPVTINAGITVTVPAGQTWTIV